MSRYTQEEIDECGEVVDHDLRLIDDRDGARSYECKRCGAEIVERTEVTDRAIHHIDGDSNNNELSNLAIVPIAANRGGKEDE